MAGRRSPQNLLISRLTSPPETIPSCYPGIRHTEFQPHFGRHHVKLRNTYELADFTTEGDFSERLIRISDALILKYKSQFGSEDAQRLTAAQVTELLYKHDLKQLRSLISEYLQEKKSVWVLFDNLDKGWSTYGVDVITRSCCAVWSTQAARSKGT
jgi:hypothetical protein